MILTVQSFKYLGSTVNQNNTIEEEIKERLMAGNKGFYANQKIFQNKLPHFPTDNARLTYNAHPKLFYIPSEVQKTRT